MYIHTYYVSGRVTTKSLLVIINSQVGLSYFMFLFKNRNNSTYLIGLLYKNYRDNSHKVNYLEVFIHYKGSYCLDMRIACACTYH